MELTDKITKLKAPIKRWNIEVFVNIDHNIQQLEDELASVNVKLEGGSSDEVDVARYQVLRSYSVIWYENKCSYWKQMSKKKVLKEMDKNSRYFHVVVAVKKRKRKKLMLEIIKGRRTFQTFNPIE